MSVYLKSPTVPPAEPNHAIFYKSVYPSIFIHFPHKKWDPALNPAFGQGSLEAKPWHESPAPGHDTRARRLARLALSCRWLPSPAEHVGWGPAGKNNMEETWWSLVR